MPTRGIISAGRTQNTSFTGGTTHFLAPAGSIATTTGTSANVRAKTTKALPYISGLSINLSSNTTDTSTRLRLQKNGADTANFLDIPAWHTGQFFSSSDAAPVSTTATDDLNLALVVGGTTSHTIHVRSYSLITSSSAQPAAVVTAVPEFSQANVIANIQNPAVNLTPNPSFEDGTTSPTGWDLTGIGANAGAITWSTAQARTGTRSVRMNPTENANFDYIFLENFPRFDVTPNKQYDFGVHLRGTISSTAANPGVEFQVRVIWYNSAGSVISTSYIMRLTGGATYSNWTLVSGRLNAPVNATSAVIHLYSDRTCDIYVDDCFLVQAGIESFVGISESVHSVVAGAAQPVTHSVTENVGITEATTVALTQRVTPTTDTVGITESISTAMSIWFVPTTDQIGITEATTVALTQRVTPTTTDQIGITETTAASIIVTAAPTTDQIGITEAIATAMSVWFAPTTDTVGITESVDATIHQYVNISSTITGPNLIGNPSAETGSTTPDSWFSSGSAGVATWASIGNTGSRSLRLTKTSAPSVTTSWSSGTFAVSGGQTHNVEFYVNGTPTVGTWQLVILWFSDTNGSTKISEDSINLTNGQTYTAWTPLQGTFTAPANAQSCYVVWRVVSGRGDVYADDFSLVQQVALDVDSIVGITESVHADVVSEGEHLTAAPETDPITITEATTVALTQRETPTTDQVTITETIATAMSVWFAPPVEQIGITEAISTSLQYQHAPTTDNVGVTETTFASVAIQTTAPIEQVTITETTATSLNKAVATTTDQVGITEDIRTVMKLASSPPTEDLGILESVSVAMGIKVPATPTVEQVGITEATSTAMALRSSIPIEQVQIQETVTPKMALGAQLTEPVAITENVVTSVTHNVIATTEPIGITETVYADVEPELPDMADVNEEVAILESVSVAMGLATDAELEPVHITEEIAASLRIRSPIEQEDIGITEDVHAVMRIASSAVEPVGVTEAVSVAMGINVTRTEQVGITEAVTTRMQMQVTAPAEQLNITEATHATLKLTGQTEVDPITITEDINAILKLGAQTTTEPLSVTEQVHAVMALTLAPPRDQTTILESVSVAMGIQLPTETSQIVITESVYAQILQAGVLLTSVNEDIGITETVHVRMVSELPPAPPTAPGGGRPGGVGGAPPLQVIDWAVIEGRRQRQYEQRLRYTTIPILSMPVPEQVKTEIKRPKKVELEKPLIEQQLQKQMVEKELVAVYNIAQAVTETQAQAVTETQEQAPEQELRLDAAKHAQELRQIETQKVVTEEEESVEKPSPATATPTILPPPIAAPLEKEKEEQNKKRTSELEPPTTLLDEVEQVHTKSTEERPHPEPRPSVEVVDKAEEPINKTTYTHIEPPSQVPFKPVPTETELARRRKKKAEQEEREEQKRLRFYLATLDVLESDEEFDELEETLDAKEEMAQQQTTEQEEEGEIPLVLLQASLNEAIAERLPLSPQALAALDKYILFKILGQQNPSTLE